MMSEYVVLATMSGPGFPMLQPHLFQLRCLRDTRDLPKPGLIGLHSHVGSKAVDTLRQS